MNEAGNEKEHTYCDKYGREVIAGNQKLWDKCWDVLKTVEV